MLANLANVRNLSINHQYWTWLLYKRKDDYYIIDKRFLVEKVFVITTLFYLPILDSHSLVSSTVHFLFPFILTQLLSYYRARHTSIILFERPFLRVMAILFLISHFMRLGAIRTHVKQIFFVPFGERVTP